MSSGSDVFAKVLTGVGEPLSGRVGVYEGRAGRWSAVPLRASHG